MNEAEVIDRVVHDHTELQEYLRQWEAALMQLTASGFVESERGLRRLWKLVPFLDRELPRHFRTEEEDLFPRAKARDPGIAAALARFQMEHAEVTRHWHAYKQELLYCDAVGATRRAYESGNWLIERFRQHMKAEEETLLPLVKEN